MNNSLYPRWIAANALGELFGLGGTLVLAAWIFTRPGEPPGAAGILLAFALAVASGAVEATVVGLAQWWAMQPWFPSIRAGAWWLGTFGGALAAYVLGYLPSTLMDLSAPASAALAAIKQLTQQIVRKYHPQKVILFGSHAYGQPRTESDVDILVIMETELPGAQQAVHILHEIDLNFGVDLVVYTPQRLAQRLEWGDSFLREAVSKGQVLYESPDIGMGR